MKMKLSKGFKRNIKSILEKPRTMASKAEDSVSRATEKLQEKAGTEHAHTWLQAWHL